jgi:DNA-binding NarL/FixJ family response regulator
MKGVSMKVFIVDDSDQIRASIKDMLSDVPGVEIAGEASHVGNLIETIKRVRPHVIILDIRMPGGNGFSVLKEIKKELPSIIVIMFTDYSYDLYRKKSMELGADFFLEKSSDFEQIYTLLNNWTKDSSFFV